MKCIKVWDPLVRLFHWSLVAAFAANALVIDDDSKLHQWVGYVVLALVGVAQADGRPCGRVEQEARLAVDGRLVFGGDRRVDRSCKNIQGKKRRRVTPTADTTADDWPSWRRP